MHPHRPRPAWQVFGVSGGAFLVGALLLIIVGSHGSGFDDTAAGVLPSFASPCPTPALLESTPCVADRVADGQVPAPLPVISNDTPSAAPTPVPDPMALTLPTLDITAPVVTTHVEPNGVVNVPADVSTVGWVQPGPAPGGPSGSAVIVGHRDGALGKNGAFYNLAQLKPGDPVIVTNVLGKEMPYRVVSREVLSKTQLALRTTLYFSSGGTSRLTLITCGGFYDKKAGGYQANVIVTAVPDVA